MEKTIQERINEYFEIVFEGTELIYDKSSMFGKVKNILEKLDIFKVIVNSENSKYNQEERQFENNVINNAIKAVNNKNDNDVVCFKVPVLTGTLDLQKDTETLKELSELCLQELKENILTVNKLEIFVEAYLDFKNKYDFIKNNINEDKENNLIKSNLFKQLLEELNIEYKTIINNQSCIEVTLQDDSTLYFNISEFNNVEDIANNLSTIIKINEEMNLEGFEIE